MINVEEPDLDKEIFFGKTAASKPKNWSRFEQKIMCWLFFSAGQDFLTRLPILRPCENCLRVDVFNVIN